MTDNKKYIINIGDHSEEWTPDMYAEAADRLFADHEDANVFELEDAEDFDEDPTNRQYIINIGDHSEVWDGDMVKEAGASLKEEHPDVKIQRVSYKDYWGERATANREQRAALLQPDADRNARLAELGYYDDLSENQLEFNMDTNLGFGLKPLSSAIETSVVTGQTKYLDPAVQEFFANDSAYTDRMAEIARLDAEYDSNPAVIAQREWEAQQRAEQAKYIDTQLAAINAEVEEIDAHRASVGAMANSMDDFAMASLAFGPKGSVDAALEDDKLQTYRSAAKLYEKARQANEVAGKGFWAAAGDVGKDKLRDLVTQSDIQMYNQIGDILTRLESQYGSLGDLTDEQIENGLSKEEQALIKGFFAYNEAMESAGQNMSTAYKGGKIFGESISFMLEFLATGGIAKGTGKAAGNLVSKGLFRWARKAAAGTAKRTARAFTARAARGLTSALVGTAARTLAAPGTYHRAAEESVKIENGHLDRTKNVFKSFADSYIENLSEISGGLIGKGLGLLGKGIGKAAYMSGIPFSKLGSLLADNRLMQTITAGWKSIAPKFEALGFHGIFEEVGEEYIGNAIREFTIQPGALAEMHKDDNFGAMLIGFAPMTLFGGAMSAVSIGAKNIEAANLGKKLRETLGQHYSEEQIDHMMNLVSGAENSKDVWEAIKPLTVGLNAEEAQQLFQYGAFMAQNKAMLFAKKAQDDNLAQAKRAELQQTYNKFWQQDAEGAESVQLATLNDGRTVFVVSEPTADGVVSIIDAATGAKGFTNVSNYRTQEVDGAAVPMTQTWSMNAYLEAEIASERRTSEQARMEREYNEQVQNLQSQIQEGTKINLGTEGNPVIMLATGKFVKDGVVAVDQAGNTHTIGWNQVADAMNKPIRVKTDQQLIDEEMAAIVARNAERRKRMTDADPAMTDAVNESAAQSAEVVAQENRHIPMNEDGTVNEAAFWEQDPEGYVQWNDEQNQDDGADSLQQVAITKAVLTSLLAEAQQAQQTSNPAERKAAKQRAQEIAEKIDRLTAIEAGYAEQRIAPLRERAMKWKSLINAPVYIVETEEDLASISGQAAASNKEGARVRGFAKDGRAYIYLPGIVEESEIDAVFMHEAVAHTGLKGLLGQQEFDELCDQVWEMMSPEMQTVFINYPGVNGNTRAAADEYIAHLAETMGAGIAEAEEKTIWQSIIDFVRNILRSMGIALNVSESELSDLIHMAYADLAKNMAEAEDIAIQQQEARVAEREAPSAARQEYDTYAEDLTHDEIKAVAENEFNAAQEAYNALVGAAPKVEMGESAKDFIARKKAYNKQVAEAKAALDARQALIDEIARIDAANAPVLTDAEVLEQEGLDALGLDESAAEGEDVRFSVASDAVLNFFNMAKEGKLKGKPIKIGSLTSEGKDFLEKLSGIKMRDNVSFALNPSDLVHIYNDHYGNNEKDKGNNIPLNDYDIRRLVDVIAFPTKVVYGVDSENRKVFYFLADTPSGAYNLMEIYANKKGTLTAKTYYKTKKGATQRVMELESLLPTSETYSGATLSNAKIPKLFDVAIEEDIRLSVITPQMDAEYLAAVERGDMETAQRMVLEAAKLAMPNTKVVDENGNPKIVYHGSPNVFYKFGSDPSVKRAHTAEDAHFFVDDMEVAQSYGKELYPVFLNITNPIVKDFEGNSWNQYAGPITPEELNEWENNRKARKERIKDLQEKIDLLKTDYEASIDENDIFGIGDSVILQEIHELESELNMATMLDKTLSTPPTHTYSTTDKLVAGSRDTSDGAIFKNVTDAASPELTHKVVTDYVAYSPKQIKSADPVTYDDNGNVIPLSERFNPEKSDIRFSVLDTTKAELKDKPIKLNGMHRFKVKSAFKGVKGADGSFPYLKAEIIEVSDGYNGPAFTFEGILEGFAVIFVPKGTISEGQKDNEFFIDPKAIESQLWDILKSAENYYEFKYAKGPYAYGGNWLNAEGNVLFSVSRGSLVGMHNISEEKLRKVIKQGGSANPSTAVIDIERQAFDSYGEISLIMPSSLVDAETGRNAGTFTADAWTPIYPQIEKRFSVDKLQRAYWRDITAIPEEMQHEVRMAFDSWLDNRTASGLAYMFLQERGEAPEMVRVAAKFPQEIKDKMSAILGEGRTGFYELTDEEKQAVLDLYIQENFGGSREDFDSSIAETIQRIEDRLSTGKVPSFVEKRITADLQWMKEHGYNYDNLSDFVRNIVSDIRHAGEVNDAATTNRALDYIKDNNLSAEYEQWKESLNDRYGIKEYLFDGYTPSGNPRWLPNTVENASKLMNKQGLAGATGMASSFNRFVATLAPKKKSLSNIRSSKDLLVEDEKLVDDFRDKWSKVFFDLGIKCQPDAKGYEDYGLERLTEAAQKKNPGAYLKKEYGVELSQEDLQRLADMIKAIKTEFPARYFETKFQRPVYLNEFAAAVIPTTTSADIKQAIAEAGLPIFEYDSSADGARREATLKATDIEGVRFSVFEPHNASMDEIDSLFHDYNGDKSLEPLYDKVSALAHTMGLQIRFDYPWSAAAGSTFGDKVKFNTEFFNSLAYKSQDKAHALLHEMIHATTNYAIAARNTGALTEGMKEAVSQLESIYGEIVNDRSFDGTYGAKSIYEMVAELSNPNFRNLLKEKNLFQRIVDAIKRLLGIEVGENALDNLSATLDYMLDNYDGRVFGAVVNQYQKHQEYTRFSVVNENQAIFVSNAARAVEGIKMEKATPAQWLAMIEKSGGLKAGEDKWMGLSDWLKESDRKTLTKQEILEFINENMIVIEEEHYGESDLSALQEEFNEIYDGIIDNVGNEEEKDLQLWEVVMNPMERAWEELRDRYYGGDDFDMAFSYDSHGNIEVNDPDAAAHFLGIKPINDTRLDYTTGGLTDNHEIALVVPAIESWNEYDDIHFGDAGEGRAVAWVRFGETTDEFGNKVLVIDEIQSKRHQEGREKGYRVTNVDKWLKDNNVEVVETGEFFEFIKNGETDRRFSKGLMNYDIEKAKRLYVSGYNKSDIPDAPFDKNWHELAMKRMLRYAAEEGYDVIAWTKGEQQAERYDIGKVISGIHKGQPTENGYQRFEINSYTPSAPRFIFTDNEGKIVDAMDNDGEEIQDYVGKNLSEVFGKDLAIKMLGAEENTRISHDEMRVGDEGMKGFYDKILPAFMNKYGKKWGIKVADITLPNVEKAGRVMHSVPVTEEMKESVMEGQVMFSAVQIDPAVRQEMDTIKAKAMWDGTFMKAPNGADTKLTEDQWLIVRTNNFKNWFGDWENDPENASKVVDENGEPMVVYHGGAWRPALEEPGKAKFRMRSGLMGRGAYFTDNFTSAADYAREKYEWEYYKEVDEDFVYDNGYITEAFLNIRDEDNIREYYGETYYLATNPSQIKSATETTGLFSESGDIRYSSRFDVNTNPTEAQKKAGNYKMGHLRLDGYNITIENPKGSVRRGTDSKGNEWENTLNNDYGYIRGTEGVDGDHIDVYLSDNPAEGNVFVIDQVNPETREFDEHKVMYGFNSMDEAREAYLANFSEGWNGLGTITEVTKDEFRKWIDSSHRKTKPFSEYKSVKAEGAQSEGYEEEDITYSALSTPTDNVVAEGMKFSIQDFARLAGNIFQDMPESFRKEAIEETFKRGWDMQSAIFQIPARLAEKENWDESDKELAKVIRDKVQEAMDESGVVMSRPLTAKEALWMLYRSTEANGDSMLDAAKRSMVAYNLGFDSRSMALKEKADDYIRYSVVRNGQIDAATDMYNYEANLWTNRLKESWLDMNQSVIALQDALADASGKPIESWENVVLALNQLSSKSYAEKKKYLRDFLMPLWEWIIEMTKVSGLSIEQIERYMMLKHGLERNKKFAMRDAKQFYREMYDKVADRMKNTSHAEQVVALSEANKRIADIDAQIATASGKKLKDLQEARERAVAEKEIAELVLRNDAAQNAQDLQDYYDNIDNELNPKYWEFREKDYGGLTSMFMDQIADVKRSDYKTDEAYQAALLASVKPRFDKVADMEAEAQKEVDDYESKAYMPALWKLVNAATKETLRHQHAAGVITTEQYDAVRNMFDYYVPLRGFADNTAEDMYSYYTNNSAGGFAKPIIAAKGRKTKAESPLGWIGTMAESAIQQDNKNEVKMKLYYALMNRPDTGVLSLSEMWYVYDHTDPKTGKKVFVPAYPPATGGVLTADQMRQHMDAWEQSMKAKQAIGEAYKREQGVNLGGSVIFQDKAQDAEHIIRVKVAGKDYAILVNGNPRAAQAINGLLNPDANVGPVRQWYGALRRGMSALMTSFSPLFWVANYQRDLLSSFMRTSLNEGWGQAFKYLGNRFHGWKAAKYIYRYDNGKMGDSYYENLYKEFAENGGITGYTSLTTNKEYEKLLADYAENVDKEMLNWIKGVWDKFMGIGEAIEQVSRFAAYITARESGKSIEEAVAAAKEVSVNFNRKGSTSPISLDELEKLRDKNGKPLSMPKKAMAIVFSAMPSALKELYFFFNASIQALSSSAKLAKKSPSKAMAWAGMYMGLSVGLAFLNYLLAGDDDDNDYLDLPDYLRHSTALFKMGDNYYFKWSLPQEMRPFYATADILVSKIMGKTPPKTAWNTVGDIALAAAEWLPVNPFGTEDPILALVPDVAAPLAEIKANQNSFGGRIYNDMSFKSEDVAKQIPAYRKGTSKTGEIYVDMAEFLNDITGGDEVQKGAININPAIVEHLVEGYGGGIYDFGKLIVGIPGLIYDAVWGEGVEVREIPFVNKVLLSTDETNMNSHVNEAFYHYRGISENAERVENEYRQSDDPSRADDYRKEDDWRIHMLFRQYEEDLKMADEKVKKAVDDTEKDLALQEQNIIREMLLNDIASGKSPDLTTEVRMAIKHLKKKVSDDMKPARDADKKRLERKRAGDPDGMLEAIQLRDSLKAEPRYQRAEAMKNLIKEIEDDMEAIGAAGNATQRDSLLGELQKKYEALMQKAAEEIE